MEKQKFKKRHFYKNVHYTINKEEQTVKITDSFFKQLNSENLWGRFGFKKIGGSSISDILETDQFKSPFGAWAHFMWIKTPILDTKYVNAGIKIEPKVLDVISQMTKEQVISYDGIKYNFDYFNNNENIGGLPDGYIENRKLLIEVKTTGFKNLEKWNKWGVPRNYIKQAQLYTYLMREKLNDLSIKDFAIVATFLEEEDYEFPENFPIEKRKVKSYKFIVNENEVLEDIRKAVEFRKKYTSKNVPSPKYDIVRDKELIEWLDIENEHEWELLFNKWQKIGKIPTFFEFTLK
ncbi:MAG: YqaJ viral recombinase family protein [Mollicutes bacterium PWAP]|nr:YqaJ viral recombinase family protein [Mollicutes bacterium PWAP]